MKKKSIIHIITRLINGGADENTVLTCNYSVALGNKVTLIIGAANDKEILSKVDKRVNLIKLKHLIRSINPIKDILALIQIKLLIKKLSPDVVHTHTSKAGVLGRIAAWLSGVPLIVHSVHILAFVNVNFVLKAIYLIIEKLIEKITDKYINVSSGMMDIAIKYKIGSPSKHSVIYSAFDTYKFKNATKAPDLEEYLISKRTADDLKIILMIAAFEKRKRHKQLIEIFSKICKKHPNTILFLVGDGKLILDIKNQVKKLELEKNVIFTGFRDDPERIIALADICIINSEREGLPRAVIQYTAGGKPSICANLPGIEEIIKDGVNGYVFNIKDFQKLYSKLSHLLSNPEDLKRLTKGAKETDVSRWSVEFMGKKIEKLYDMSLSIK